MRVFLGRTPEGRPTADFVDSLNRNCSLQTDENLHRRPTIAIGMHCNSEAMYLTQVQLQSLLPLLQHFVETGELPLV